MCLKGDRELWWLLAHSSGKGVAQGQNTKYSLQFVLPALCSPGERTCLFLKDGTVSIHLGGLLHPSSSDDEYIRIFLTRGDVGDHGCVHAYAEGRGQTWSSFLSCCPPYFSVDVEIVFLSSLDLTIR